MHNQKIGVIDVQLDRLEKILHSLLLCAVSIYEVFTGSPKNDLPGDTDLRIFFKAYWRFLLVSVIKDNGNACFGDSCLAALVNEVLSTRVSKVSSSKAPLLACKFCALTVVMFVIPRTKHIESSIFDLPLPFNPVIELKLSSHPEMTTRLVSA